MIGSIIIALLGGRADAQDPAELARWRAVVPVAIPAECRAVAEGGALRIDCGGAALLLEDAAGSDPRKIALQHQLEPFALAGLPISPTAEIDCQLLGEPARCLEVTLSIHGSRMVLRSGAREQWVGTCLYRGTVLPEVCQVVFQEALEPASEK
jgi:hypothetical protein